MKTNNFSIKLCSFFAVVLSALVLCFSVFGLLPPYNSFAASSVPVDVGGEVFIFSDKNYDDGNFVNTSFTIPAGVYLDQWGTGFVILYVYFYSSSDLSSVASGCVSPLVSYGSSMSTPKPYNTTSVYNALRFKFSYSGGVIHRGRLESPLLVSSLQSISGSYSVAAVPPSDSPLPPPSYDGSYIPYFYSFVVSYFSSTFVNPRLPQIYISSDDLAFLELFYDHYNVYSASGSSELPDPSDPTSPSYQTGYQAGYTDGLNKGQSDQFTSPFDMVFKPVQEFLSIEFFGVSLGTFFAVLVFVMLGLIFLKMFSGG